MFKKYLIGVSGGPDSMALLNKKRFFIKAVCHVNYHDREDTNNDERIVRNYCKKHKIALFVFDTQKDNISKFLNNKNAQTFYRKIRYDFFVKKAQELNLKKCLIAHNKNDFLESAYMNLEKGKKNLYLGIRKKSQYQSIVLVRPLLNKTKLNLQKYCEKRKIVFAIDYSNFTNIYQRNIVRKKMNKWSKKDLAKFYWKIKINNLRNYFWLKYFDKKFNLWIKKDFSVNFFLKIKNKKEKSNIIYLLLNYLHETPNANKIFQIIDFIEKNKFNSNKKYRLKTNHFIEIKNNKIRYINE